MTTEPLRIRIQPPRSVPERPNEGRVGVSFGDHIRALKDGLHWHCTLNGAEITNDTKEAQAGHRGWVLIHERDAEGNVFARDGEVATTIEVGDVRAWTCGEAHPKPASDNR